MITNSLTIESCGCLQSKFATKQGLSREKSVWYRRSCFWLLFFIFLVLICKIYWFGWLLHYASHWDSYVPLFGFSGAIYLISTTLSFYHYIDGFSTLKCSCSLCAFYLCCCCHVFVVAPSIYLQVGGILFLLNIVLCLCVDSPNQGGIRALG